MPFSNVGPARTRATRCGAFTARHLACADSISLNAIAIPAALDPGPLVTRCRNRTVAKGRFDRVGGAQVDPVFGRVVVEREQDVEVVGDLRGGLGPLRCVEVLERLGGLEGVVAVLGAPDLR